MTVKIWDILEGPVHRDECPYSYEWPKGTNYSMLCKAEEDGELFDADFYFEAYEDAYEWKIYFETNIEPLIINSEENDA
tara:strand:+ start:613 stop:849 length:237 start_codon:yes stop_codon:yes gene_type:complete